MALGTPPDADPQLLPRGLLDAELPHARGGRVPPHQQGQLQAGPEKGTDRLLVSGLPNILPIYCQDAVPHPQATASGQAAWEHLLDRKAAAGGPRVGRIGLLDTEPPTRPSIYLGDEHARLLDTKRVARVVGAPNNAEPQGAPSPRQTDLLGT